LAWTDSPDGRRSPDRNLVANVMEEGRHNLAHLCYHPAVMTRPQPQSIHAKISAARAALGFERVWSALLWPTIVLAVGGTVVLSGVLQNLPHGARIAALIVLAIVFLWSFKALLGLSWPTRYEAMRRIEDRTGLRHRPVSGHDDRLADGADPHQQAIWEEHRLRQLKALGNLRAGAPRSSWRDLDPQALRVPAFLALLAALILGPGDPRDVLTDSLAGAPSAEASSVTLDAWLKPPAYTAKPPVLLTSPAMMERLASDPEITVPEKSVLTIRLTSGKTPKVSFHDLAQSEEGLPETSGLSAKTNSDGNLFRAETVMTRPAIVRVTDGDREIARWRISLVPDAPPTIEVTKTPTGDASGTLSVPWKAADDYGVTSITSDLYLADEQDGGIGFASNGIFRFNPPILAVPLRKSSPKEEAGTAKASLAEHPWAGFMMDLTLTAKDAGGNSTDSATANFRLPERVFTKLLARALIEQRRNLILEPEKSGHVVQMLDALLTYPDGLIDGSGTHIAIAAVKSHLSHALTQAEADEAIPMLWQIAVGIEEGRYADARAELDALRKELERALREGASPERIAELMNKLRQAMDRYMQSLMDETARRMQQGQMNGDKQMQQGQTISPQDLQKMLDMIEQLAQSGANDAAQQLLSQLEDILRNLQPGMAQQQGPPRDSPLGKMLDQLSDLMRQQQQLMDDTQRSQQGENGTMGDQQQGQQGLSDLGDRQRGLGEMLQDLMDQFGRNGMQAPKSFGDAGQEMRGAEGSLKQGDRPGALGRQGEALSRLREGAQGLARQMMQQGQGQQGTQGRHGEARGDDRDPLGRPLPNRGEDYGPERNMLPSELAIQRAREILDQLRSRAGETGLPRIERDYIERLLRGLY
jgi:uncharacterized protein (TIGR02302 family)